MVALNFQPEFAEAVEHGVKLQTIRRTARCKAGDRLQFYTGQRTQACRKLGEGICKRVMPVEINHMNMKLDGRPVYMGDAKPDDLWECDNDFARRDGFLGFEEMAQWFYKRYGALPFKGFVIEWRLIE
jgi:hypothetical protein